MSSELDRDREHRDVYDSAPQRALAAAFSRPHTLTLLIALVLSLLYIALQRPPDASSQSNTLYGAILSGVPLLLYGCLQFRDGLFRRPHVIVWRLVMGISLLYEMLLVFILMQSSTDARALMNLMDPHHAGILLPERSYASSCALTFSSITDALDIFVVGHAAGWFVKAVMVRDRVLLWVASVFFELLELVFKRLLPNFAECWWDSWILDVALCNALGIELGLALCRYLNAREYHWIFSPQRFDAFRWQVLTSRFRFVAASSIVFLLMVADLNAFFLKTVLWVDVESKLNIIRLFIIGFAGFPSLRELYQYASDPTCHRFGSQAWILSAVLLTEICIIIKFGREHFSHSASYYFPLSTRLAAALAITTYLAILTFAIPSQQQHQTQHHAHSNKLN
mmetsp:Transcript_17448/g.37901  ORF Transcript_17448/g.37901 Transcript_17448/m.37901 type:complete len:395 (-) Transcript_17448:53-1237(-)